MHFILYNSGFKYTKSLLWFLGRGKHTSLVWFLQTIGFIANKLFVLADV